MRAVAVQQLGDAPKLQDVPVPIEDGTFLVHVTYAGVNPVDYKSIGRLTANSKYPFIIGRDFAGIVDRVSASEPRLRPGERVFGFALTGGSYAEYTAIVPPEDLIALIPDSVSDEQAAALPVAGMTALGSVELVELRKSQRFVVTGASGSVGGYAVQMARARGVHVVGVVRGDDGEATSLGADEVYDTEAGNAIDHIRKAHPDGVDAVLDVTSDAEAIREFAKILRPGGKIVSTLHAADESWFADRQIKAYNIGPDNNPAGTDHGLTELAQMLAQGTITTRVRSVEPLGNALDVLDRLRAGTLPGKTVIRI